MTAKKVPSEPKPEKFVSEERFNKLEESVGKVADLLEKVLTERAAAPQTKEDKAVAEAGPNKYQTNDEWDEMAREIIGDALDHTEVEHTKSGGIKFTIVVKLEKSNAPKEYLERTKSDRRTREVAAEGIGGVEAWCRLVKANLARPRS